jgi:MauM/NapG family ferredoxin protein
MNQKRRNLIFSFLAGAALPLVLPIIEKLPAGSKLKRYLRPPGALPERAFLDACIGCGQCVNVCPNKCITMHALENGLDNLATPRVNARSQGCTLCMACTQVCPTGALEKLEATEEGKRAVTMGIAFLAEDLCYSYAGRTCGVCYRACPLPGHAMTIGLFEKPTVVTENCVGCGLCEQSCVHMPQAIRIVPTAELEARKEV